MTTSRRRTFHDLVMASGKSLDRLSSPPLIMTLLGAAALGLVLLTTWGCQKALPLENTPMATAFKTPTPDVPQKLYANKLYYFGVNLNDATESFGVDESASDCKGTVFSSNPAQQDGSKWTRAEFRICYLGTVSTVDADTLLQQLDQRSELVKKSLHPGADAGLPKACKIGRDRLACIERHVQGRDKLGQGEMRWYQAVVGYEGRLYAVEAMCDSAGWDAFWPSFQNLVGTLRFDSGVVPQVTP